MLTGIFQVLPVKTELIAIWFSMSTPRLLRAGWISLGKTRSFLTEFAYPHSDHSVFES